jgi:sirohydrochlorin ferrochelatase
MFLANGMHIQSDIPEEIEVLRKKYPDVSITMTAHIGADPRIADILVERIKEAK